MPEQRTQQEMIPSYRISLNGSALPADVVPDVLAVEVEQHIDGSDCVDLELSAWDMERQDFKYLDGATFSEGSVITVSMGYGEELVDLIEAEIVALEIDFGADTAPVVRLRGYDRLHRFRRGRKTRTFQNVTDSAVAEEIAQSLKLQAEVEDSEVVHDHLFQYNQSDIDFLKERARRIDFEVDVRESTLHFRRAAFYRGSTVTLRYRDDLRTFSLRLSTQAQLSKVVVRGWDVQSKEAIVGTGEAADVVSEMGGATLGSAIAGSSFGDAEELILDRPVFAASEADQIAKAIFNRASIGFIAAEGECLGNAVLRAGEVIDVGNLGGRFSGLYYVTSTHHVIDAEGYRTRFTCRRNTVS